MVLWVRRALDIIILACSISLLFFFPHHTIAGVLLCIASAISAIVLLVLTAIAAND